MMRSSVFVLVLLLVGVACATPRIGGGHSAWRRVVFEEEARLRSAGVRLPQAQWFAGQLLDHFDHTNTATWSQRYFVNDTFYDHKNPVIFFQVGGEGAVSAADVVVLQASANYAQTYSAISVTLEHRFYGESKPLPTLATSNLRYLATEQALADAAVFLQWFRKEVLKAPGAPIITFGCSYPGAMAAFFRLKYPEVTLGSVASSGPIQAEADFYQYMQTVDKSIDYFSGEECDARIRNATTMIEAMLQTAAGRAQLVSDYVLCQSPVALKDQQTFMASLMGNWQGVAQYNDENGNPINVAYLCNMMNNASQSPYDAYRQVNSFFLKMNGESCLDISYADGVKQLTNTTQPAQGVGIRSWIWQSCTEYGFWQTTDSDAQPFGNMVPMSYSADQCADAYDGYQFTNKSMQQTNEHFGGQAGWKPHTSSNVLFVSGRFDPWHTLTVYHNISMASELTAYLIDDTAHCANVLPSRSTDSPDLVHARVFTSKAIGRWLDELQREDP